MSAMGGKQTLVARVECEAATATPEPPQPRTRCHVFRFHIDRHKTVTDVGLLRRQFTPRRIESLSDRRWLVRGHNPPRRVESASAQFRTKVQSGPERTVEENLKAAHCAIASGIWLMCAMGGKLTLEQQVLDSS